VIASLIGLKSRGALSLNTFFKPIAWILIYALIVPPNLVYSQNTPAPEPTPTPTVTPDPNSPDYLRWFDDMARRFNIFTNLGRLLRDKMDIDLVVGDPWTLRPDTMIALRRIPDRVRLRLFSFISANAAHIFSTPDPGGIGNPPSSITDPGGTMGGAPINVTIPDDLTRSMTSTISDSIFSGALSDSQLIDLAVFILSKAPFFPKTKEGWDQFKNKLVEWDIYLALIVVIILAFFDQGSLGFSGYLVEAPGGIRIGWYTNMKRLGFSLEPEVKGGIAIRHQYFDTRMGVIKKFGDDDRTRVEAEIVGLFFAALAQKIGWEGRSSFRFEYTLNSKNPMLQNDGNITISLFARKGELFFKESPFSVSILASGGSNLKGKPLGSASIAVENDHDGYQIALTGGYGPPAYQINPDPSIQNPHIWTGGLLATWQVDGGYRQIANMLENTALSVMSDLDHLDTAKKRIEGLKKSGIAEDSDQFKRSLFWLGMARVQLKKHLESYRELSTQYAAIRSTGDLDRAPLQKSIFLLADHEARGETYGAEVSNLNVWQL
jgi:hypothetical protein